MSRFNWRKNIEDSLRDGLIITIGAAGIFSGLKVVNVKPPKASLDAMDIVKLTGGTCGGVLVKYYAVYKKWINKCYNKNFITFIGSKDYTWKVQKSFQHCKCFTFQSLKCRWNW